MNVTLKIATAEGAVAVAVAVAAPARKREERVVVIPCGAAKLTHPAPAGELYTGRYHRACRAAADALTAAGGRVLILSSLYGLVPLGQVLQPYDVDLGEAGAVTGDVLRGQARELGVYGAADVTVLAGAAYVDAARQVWPDAVAPLAGAGGMGYQMQRLTELRRTPDA